jgi:hypothetical protein
VFSEGGGSLGSDDSQQLSWAPTRSFTHDLVLVTECAPGSHESNHTALGQTAALSSLKTQQSLQAH